MINHPNRTMNANYRVTGDFLRLTYSQHRSKAAAWRAAKALASKWGWSHPGSEPRVERNENGYWIDCGAAADRAGE
jgi:hypothetical protein